jgi:hypothetical protein
MSDGQNLFEDALAHQVRLFATTFLGNRVNACIVTFWRLHCTWWGNLVVTQP